MKVSSTSTSVPGPPSLSEGDALHGKPDAVQHEPCGLLSDSQSAADFVGADSVLAVGKHPSSSKPLVQGDRAILENGSDLDRELALRG